MFKGNSHMSCVASTHYPWAEDFLFVGRYSILFVGPCSSDDNLAYSGYRISEGMAGLSHGSIWVRNSSPCW